MTNVGYTPLYRLDAIERIQAAEKSSEIAYRSGAVLPKDYGITGSTFRAYQKCDQSPSSIFRSWADTSGFKLVVAASVKSRTDFLQLHQKLASSFDLQWQGSGNRSLSIAEKYKVTDLFVKALAFKSEHPCESSRQALYQYANIPLDKFSLLAVKKFFYGIVISGNPSMGDIRDYETYDFLQTQIYSLTQMAKIPNLVFDHYAWDLKNRLEPNT